MNIFYLAKNPTQAAAYHCDKHVVKMILETAQMLSTAHRVLDGPEFADHHNLPKIAHKNHPSTVWVRESSQHYLWAAELFLALLHEHKRRYGTRHKYWDISAALAHMPYCIVDKGWTIPPQCMPDEYKHKNTVRAYRDYYKGAKTHFAVWNKLDNTPKWWLTA